MICQMSQTACYFVWPHSQWDHLVEVRATTNSEKTTTETKVVWPRLQIEPGSPTTSAPLEAAPHPMENIANRAKENMSKTSTRGPAQPAPWSPPSQDNCHGSESMESNHKKSPTSRGTHSSVLVMWQTAGTRCQLEVQRKKRCIIIQKLKGVSQHLCSLESNTGWFMLTEAVTSDKKGAPDVEQRGKKKGKRKDQLKRM